MSTPNFNNHPYPATPPECQLPETRGQMCAGCPFGPECGYLALATTVSKLEEENLNLDARWRQVFKERDEERAKRIAENRDPVIPNFLTVNGVMARIESDAELAEELQEGRAGVVYIDLRGLHAKNEALGDFAGDHDLQQGGLRLLEAHRNIVEQDRRRVMGGLRLETLEFQQGEQRAMRTDNTPERRRHPSTIRDIGYRGQRADELVVLVRSVNPRQLHDVADRVEELFSVDRARSDSKEGKLPLVATVARAHVDELHLEYTRAIDIFQAVHDLARIRHENMKTSQYAEMWDLARRTAREEHGRAIRKPRDPRIIYQAFMQYCCPDFAANAREYYIKNGVRVKEQPQHQ